MHPRPFSALLQLSPVLEQLQGCNATPPLQIAHSQRHQLLATGLLWLAMALYSASTAMSAATARALMLPTTCRPSRLLTRLHSTLTSQHGVHLQA